MHQSSRRSQWGSRARCTCPRHAVQGMLHRPTAPVPPHNGCDSACHLRTTACKGPSCPRLRTQRNRMGTGALGSDVGPGEHHTRRHLLSQGASRAGAALEFPHRTSSCTPSTWSRHLPRMKSGTGVRHRCVTLPEMDTRARDRQAAARRFLCAFAIRNRKTASTRSMSPMTIQCNEQGTALRHTPSLAGLRHTCGHHSQDLK